MNIWIYLSTLIMVIHQSCGSYCDPTEIQKCLQPSLDVLQYNTSNGSQSQGFLQTAIKNYFTILQQTQEDSTYHILAFEAVMVKLDDVFTHPLKLQKACSVFNESKHCLLVTEDYCDQEVRDELQGIENVFGIMCHKPYMQVFEATYRCLSDPALKMKRENCDSDMLRVLQDVGEQLPITTHNEYEYETHWDEKNTDAGKTCYAVHSAVTCYVNAVRSDCGEDLANWERRLRHSLVEFLLIDIQCENEDTFEYIEPLQDESQYFVCHNNEAYVDWDKTCNGQEDCRDGSDEWVSVCSRKRWNLLDIVLIILGCLVAVIVIIVCIVKWHENITYTVRHKLGLMGPREMQTFVNEEELPEDSTPPTQRRAFKYEQLSPTHVTENVHHV